MSERVLVTGVTGLVGSRAAELLAADGITVIGLARDPVRAQRAVPAIAKAYPFREQSALPGEALEGVRAVIHLAGEPVAGRWSEDRKRRIESSRIEGTRRVVDAIAARPASERPEVLVCASGIGYYGDTGEREVREDDPPGDDFLARVCVGWEREAARAEAHGVRAVSLRIGLVLSKRGGALEAMLPAFRAGLGGPIGSGDQWWPWIHLDDLVALARHAIASRGLRGAIHATAPEVLRQRDFARTLARVLRRPALLPAPAFAVRAVLGELATELLASRRAVSGRAIESGFVHRFPALEPALRDLLEK